MKSQKFVSAIVASTAGIVFAATATAQASGQPQRFPQTPPGLMRVLAERVPGIARAIVANEG
jgi:hypothetical protein